MRQNGPGTMSMCKKSWGLLRLRTGDDRKMGIEMIIPVYLIVLNILGFALFGYDKRCAVLHRWRVPEKTLFMAAVLGGSVGAYVGMQVFRHKTRHWKFRLGIPAVAAIQCALAYSVLVR